MPLTVGFDATSAARQRAGIGRYTRELLSGLSARSDQTRYRVFYSAGGRPAGWLPQLDDRFRILPIPLSDRVTNALWHRAHLPVPVQAITGRVDLFHSPDFSLPPLLGCPGIVTVHDLAFLTVPDCAYPTLAAYLRRVVPKSARRASRVIAVSEHTRRDVISLLGLSPERVVTVLEGVSPRFRPLPAIECTAVVQRLGIDQPYLLSLGTLEPRKNYVRLLEAYAVTRSRGLDRPLVIAGATGWLFEPIFQRLRELRLEDHVHFIRPEDGDLPALYCAADAFVYPSLYEGFGIPPLEALACGAPVACSNSSSLPEVVGEAAILFDPLDVEAIADALQRIMTDTVLRNELKRRGPLRAACFSWQTAAGQTVQVYHEAVQDG